jgi:hypothetical protein
MWIAGRDECDLDPILTMEFRRVSRDRDVDREPVLPLERANRAHRLRPWTPSIGPSVEAVLAQRDLEPAATWGSRSARRGGERESRNAAMAVKVRRATRKGLREPGFLPFGFA